MTPRAIRAVERLLLLAGFALFVFLLRELGLQTVTANLRLVGWGIAPIVAQEILAYSANTLGWMAAFPQTAGTLRFADLLLARIAGDAVNYVTPTATIGGEIVRTRVLRGRAPGTALVASVAVAKVSQTVAQVTFVLIGLVIVIDDTPLSDGVRHALMGGLSFFIVVAAALVLAQRRGMFGPLLRLGQRFGLTAHAPDLVRRLEVLDAEIARYHVDANGAFVLSCAAFFAGWALGILEIYLILWFLGVMPSVHLALTIEVLSVAIDGMLFFVPAKMGTQEGGKVLIFTALGLDPAQGLALGILRRIRELTWALIGLLILSRTQLSSRRPALQPSR